MAVEQADLYQQCVGWDLKLIWFAYVMNSDMWSDVEAEQWVYDPLYGSSLEGSECKVLQFAITKCDYDFYYGICQ